MKLSHYFCCAAALLVLCSGCMHSGYKGESYPETEAVEVYSRNQAVPDGYSMMGRGWVSGELSGTTRPELEAKLQKLARKHGADAIVIVGSVIRPDGTKINDSAQDFAVATDSAAQGQLSNAVTRDLNCYGDDNHEKRFERLIVADFLHKELPAK